MRRGYALQERSKVRSKLEGWTLVVLHEALDAFDLPRGSGPEGQKVRAGMLVCQ